MTLKQRVQELVKRRRIVNLTKRQHEKLCVNPKELKKNLRDFETGFVRERKIKRKEANVRNI